jgi:hypothetical protein
LRADVRDQIPLDHFRTCLIKEDIGSLRGTDSHGWGRKAELGHVLEAEKRRWVCQPLPNDTASGAATTPVLPELRADVRDQNSARHFRTCFIKEDIGSPDARYRFT